MTPPVEPDETGAVGEREGQALADAYRDRMSAKRVLTPADQVLIQDLLSPIPNVKCQVCHRVTPVNDVVEGICWTCRDLAGAW